MLSTIRTIALLGGAALALGSCSGIVGKREAGPPPAARPSPPRAVVQDLPVKIGNPYQVGSVTYTPADPPSYDEVGYASWYGEEVGGNATANGERFNPGGISGAHKTLPLPSYVEVTALDNGRTILVRLNDRGPFSNDRLIDLSRGAAEQLGIAGGGAAAVRVRRVNPPDQERATLRAGGRAAERLETPAPLLVALRSKLQAAPGSLPPAPVVALVPPKAQASVAPKPVALPKPAVPQAGISYVVQAAAFSSRERAAAAAKRIGATASPSGALWRVRYGPYPSEAAAAEGVKRAAASGFPGARIMVNE
ncbi:septal ring lytic transglycosylase RlpA family protein [Sphingobium subterraneum]|uniref:Endolytic peptidoglycan transglycosylase RlpA n=1 Tax=Sphingobium subterraneum TaxID=627688 RepID=A0A841J216_9SPHN|nr:SPOR domain-containing protein [Sphingobium subterraneum]MBB6122578.1 rare lipoprotein A [Sphingobium subterraneum]